MSQDDVKNLGLPLAAVKPITCLYVGSAIDWLSEHTTLTIDKDDIETIKNLPDGAKLFICKFIDIMENNESVTSESISGVSQSFSTETRENLLSNIACSLIGKYLKSSVSVVPNVSNWS